MMQTIKLLVILAACSFGAAWAQEAPPETVTYTYSGVPLPITTDDADIISLASILVPRSLEITDVDVRVRISYPEVGDLDVYVYSATGERVKLLDTNCGDLVNVDTTFDDEVPNEYSEFCPVEAGRGPFRGWESLSEFDGENSLGLWTLSVENVESDSRVGWLTDFAVTITGDRVVQPAFVSQTVVNLASYAGGSIAPGELISIFGNALGPETPVTAPAGSWPLTLEGTSVFFDGVQVPVAYTSYYRVDVQVPFNVTPGSSVNLKVTFGENSSAEIPFTVAGTAPGVFTNETGGTGQAKAYNHEDGQVNSNATPASRGNYISVYATGLGDVTPALTVGQVPSAGTIYTAVEEVTATIGGVKCDVYWAGAAPGWPGVYQVNILVSDQVPLGNQPLVLAAGGHSSKAGVTVAISRNE